MPRWILGLLLACESSTPAPVLEPQGPDRQETVPSTGHESTVVQNLPPEAIPALTRPGRSVLRLLDHLQDATLSLPDDNVDPTWSRRLPLKGPWIASKNGQSWRARLPSSVKEDIGSGTPRNLQLLKDGEPLPFLARLNTPRNGQICWQVREGWLHVYSLGNPKHWDSPPQLERSAQSKAMDRLNHRTSGLTPAVYARSAITIGKSTRETLLLPAPGSASFELDLPSKASLRMGIGIANIPGLESHATAGLEVQVNGESVWSRELSVQDPWEEVDLSLSRWAGQRVMLSFQSTSLGSAHGDWVALAEPEILGGPQEEGPRRILVLGLDTLRPDHLGTHGYTKATSPFLDTLATESLVFERAWAPAPRTRPSFRTVNTGRWPSKARNAPTLGAMLSDAGFSTAGIVANVHLSPEMGFSTGYGNWLYAHSGDAEDQVDRALTWLEGHAEEDSFLFLHFMDPHIFYLAPDPWTDRFTEGEKPQALPDRYNRRSVERMQARGELSETTRAFIQGRYDGEIGYLDSELRRLIEAVDALPGETLVVLVSDHGEEFWDHGEFEHNHSLYEELTRTLFWIRPPRGSLTDGPYRVTANVSLADLAPTLLEFMGESLSEHPPMDGTSLHPLVQGAGSEARKDLLTGLRRRSLPMGHLMYATERWGVVSADHKYILHRGSGEQELYNLRDDPTEQHNLADIADDLSGWWSRLESATGYPTGEGWRLEMDQLTEPIQLQLEHPIQSAEVLDPESLRPRRSNQEWGETPPLCSDDIATLRLEADGTRLHVTPGDHGRGTLVLLGDANSIQVLNAQGQPLAEPFGIGDRLKLEEGLSLKATPSVVILAGETESPQPGVRAEDAQRAALKSLGYLE